MHFASSSFHFFASSNEMRPVRAFHEDIGQHRGDQLARCIFIEESHRIDRLELQREFCARLLIEKGPRRTFQPLHTRICIQRENKHVAERARALEQPNVTGVQNVVTAIREYNLLALRFPVAALFDQFFARVETAHYHSHFTIGQAQLGPECRLVCQNKYAEISALRRMARKIQFQKIIVRATNWVGDAVMSVSALQALREHFPDAHISILARPWVAALYGREPFCDELIPYGSSTGLRGLRHKVTIASELRRRKFDCAILFQNAFEAAALVRLAGVPVRIGYDRDARGWLLTRAVPVPRPGDTPRHQRFYYLELLKRAGLIHNYLSDCPIRLSGARAAAQAGRVRLRDAAINGAVVGVSPGAAYGSAKRWLPDRFADAALTVARERGAAIAIFGSKEESNIGELVQRRVEAAGQQCVNFAGSTSLAEFIELAAACDVYLTNDSGPMHIASALGVPTVAIFGATDDVATGPTGTQSRVVREPVECSPCLLRECPIDHRCMTRVSAERVAEVALSLVEIENK